MRRDKAPKFHYLLRNAELRLEIGVVERRQKIAEVDQRRRAAMRFDEHRRGGGKLPRIGAASGGTREYQDFRHPAAGICKTDRQNRRNT